jgi:hypothetical protein
LGQIDLVPDQPHNLALAHGGFDGDGNDGGQFGVHRPASGQQALFLIANETPIPASGYSGFTDQFDGVAQGFHPPLGTGDIEQVRE